MKNLVLGILLTLFLQLSLNVLNLYKIDTGDKDNSIMDFSRDFIEGDYFAFPLTNRCGSKEAIEWFQCDKFQQLINVKLYKATRTRGDK